MKLDIRQVDDKRLRRFGGWRFIIRSGEYSYMSKGDDQDLAVKKSYMIDEEDAGHMELRVAWDPKDERFRYMAPEAILTQVYVMCNVHDGVVKAADVWFPNLLGFLEEKGMAEFSSMPVTR